MISTSFISWRRDRCTRVKTSEVSEDFGSLLAIRPRSTSLLAALFLTAINAIPVVAQTPTEADYYRLIPFEIPAYLNLEPGGIELLPNGRLAVSTRRGDIYMIDEPFADPPTNVRWTPFAKGLHEVLGIHAVGDWLYATQRCE